MQRWERAVVGRVTTTTTKMCRWSSAGVQLRREARRAARRDLPGVSRRQRAEFDLVAHAKRLKVQLSPEEVETMKSAVRRRRRATHPRGGTFTRSDFDAMVRKDQTQWSERQTLVKYIAEADENTVGQRLLLALDYLGTALFAVVGTQVAGQAHMNVVGSALVACVASMGGGTLNNVMTANTRGGVFWMRDPTFLAIALGSSLLTFYFWPEFEEWRAGSEFQTLQRAARAGLETISPPTQDETAMTLEQFERALKVDSRLGSRIVAAALPHLDPEVAASLKAAPSLAPALVFEWLDREREGVLRPHELRLLARLSVMSSAEMYVLETLALGAVAVIGAQAGVARGLSFLPSIACGVSICFGGVLRDVLCHRDIALGAQSYALATAAGATVYVSLRQLVVHRILRIPLILRIFAGASTAIAQRAWVYYYDDISDQALRPMAIYVPPPPKAPLNAQTAAEALCDAASRNDVPRLRLLIGQMGYDPAASDYDQRTPLHLAAAEGAYDAVRFLADHGCHLNPRDRWGRTPLDDADDHAYGSPLVAAFLRARGATPGASLSNSSSSQ